MALLLARRQQRFPSTLSLIRLFSNSSSDAPPKAVDKFSTYSSPFTDVKTSLKQKSSQAPNHGSLGSLQDLSIKLAKFRRRSAVPPPPNGDPPLISLETLYKQKGALRRNVLGRGEALPPSVIGNGREGETETEFLKSYREDELGEKLKMLRPEGKKEEGCFSLEELNQRLVKLREVDEKEVKNQRGNFSLLRNVIGTFEEDEKAKNEVVSLQSLDFLECLDGTPEYKHYPPKDALVETYFHSDNLSSAEKIKIELTKVGEDFKMSESDCGSARVQVAQLTTKIKHLSRALHKKDKHSRKGLVAMVQKRKKLLNYLRRTDWDSYCLVLSELKLRDNPDYKL